MTHTAPAPLQSVYTPATTSPAMRGSLRALAATGFINAAAIVAGIVAISFIPDQMNTKAFDRALAEIAARPHAEIIAGWMFALSLAALIPFVWFAVRSLSEPARLPATIGACIITAGATVDIVASLIFVAVGHGVAPSLSDPAARSVGTALLTLGACVDSMYNLMLGVGLMLVARSMLAGGLWPRWLGRLAAIAGMLSLPVALEWYSPAAAAVQYASGTLFLVWVTGMSVVAVRRSRRLEGSLS